jgi:hypothetical protein
VLNTANADSPIAAITASTGPVTHLLGPNSSSANITNFNPNESHSNTTSVITNSSPPLASPASSSEQPPTQTTITSATDGDGNALQNGSTTFSKTISVQVRATQGSNPISGFECSIDNKPFSMCANTNPATINFNNLTAGQQHTVAVRAIDNVANTDPNPATLRWTIISSQQAIQKLVSTIDNMNLSRGASISLETPLLITIRTLNGHLNTAACNTFNAFINNIDANQATGQLTAQQAATLQEQAAPIQYTMECASSSVSPLFNSGNTNTGSISISATDTLNHTTSKLSSPAITIRNPNEALSPSLTQAQQHKQTSPQQQPITANALNSHNDKFDNHSPSVIAELPF